MFVYSLKGEEGKGAAVQAKGGTERREKGQDAKSVVLLLVPLCNCTQQWGKGGRKLSAR